MKYKVKALCVNLTAEPHTFTEPRDEIIDTINNSIFHDCASIRDIEIVYEDFWNYLNSEHEIHDPSSKVKCCR